MIKRAPYKAKPTDKPAAPNSMIPPGLAALAVTEPLTMASYMAASGPIALATSLAPWAKLSKAAENTKGQVNRLLTPSLLRSSRAALAASGLNVSKYTANATTPPHNNDQPNSTLNNW